MAYRILPVDQNGFPILALSYGRTTTLAFTASTDRVQIPTLEVGIEDVLRLASTAGCYINFGDSTVVATSSDVYFPGGVETVKVPDNATHLSAIRFDTDGNITITEMV